MPRQYGPFNPAIYSENAERIIESATEDKKSAAQRAADQKAAAYMRAREKASQEVSPDGGPHGKFNIYVFTASMLVVAHMHAIANTSCVLKDRHAAAVVPLLLLAELQLPPQPKDLLLAACLLQCSCILLAFLLLQQHQL